RMDELLRIKPAIVRIYDLSAERKEQAERLGVLSVSAQSRGFDDDREIANHSRGSRGHLVRQGSAFARAATFDFNPREIHPNQAGTPVCPEATQKLTNLAFEITPSARHRGGEARLDPMEGPLGGRAVRKGRLGR